MMGFPNTDRPIMKTTLLQHIQSLRDQLVHTGMHEGLSHEKTIHLSQKLDKYIFLYQSFEKQNIDNLLQQ
jgi:Spo0E like sporulation regulatory protein